MICDNKLEGRGGFNLDFIGLELGNMCVSPVVALFSY
jgi:hypothetical protein